MATVIGTDAPQHINAADGVTYSADNIFGLGGDDDISALGGNDNIKGGGGADFIDGGSGSDTANYSDSDEWVLVTLVTGKGYFGTAAGDTLVSIENVGGSDHDDILIGNNGNNDLTGLDGDDTLKGGGGADRLYGGDDNDTLMGGAGADVLYGGAGIDTAVYDESPAAVIINLWGNSASGGDAEGDSLFGVENLTGSDYGDTVYGSIGSNVLDGGLGNDTFFGNWGADTLLGGAGGDWLYGQDGDDILYGGTGNDEMIGGVGNDVYYVDSQDDVVTEQVGEGNDTVYASVSYELEALNIEVLSLQFGTGTDAIGNDESQTILGNALNNVIDGGGSSDTLSGLGGNDTFVFGTNEANGDVVFEFVGNGSGAGDSLKFVGFGTLAQGASFTQVSATEWIIHSGLDSHEEVITLYADALGQVGAAVDASDLLFL